MCPRFQRERASLRDVHCAGVFAFPPSKSEEAHYYHSDRDPDMALFRATAATVGSALGEGPSRIEMAGGSERASRGGGHPGTPGSAKGGKKGFAQPSPKKGAADKTEATAAAARSASSRKGPAGGCTSSSSRRLGGDDSGTGADRQSHHARDAYNGLEDTALTAQNAVNCLKELLLEGDGFSMLASLLEEGSLDAQLRDMDREVRDLIARTIVRGATRHVDVAWQHVNARRTLPQMGLQRWHAG